MASTGISTIPDTGKRSALDQEASAPSSKRCTVRQRRPITSAISGIGIPLRS
jgi:hypothetical protein